MHKLFYESNADNISLSSYELHRKYLRNILTLALGIQNLILVVLCCKQSSITVWKLKI